MPCKTILNKVVTSAALAGLIALPLLAHPTTASASCRGRANTGTAIGGVGGALIGNSIWHGGGGAVVGGVGGAVAGHEIAKSGCTTSSQHATQHRNHSHYSSSTTYQPNHATGGSGRPAPQTYYDERGNRIAPGGG